MTTGPINKTAAEHIVPLLAKAVGNLHLEDRANGLAPEYLYEAAQG